MRQPHLLLGFRLAALDIRSENKENREKYDKNNNKKCNFEGCPPPCGIIEMNLYPNMNVGHDERPDLTVWKDLSEEKGVFL